MNYSLIKTSLYLFIFLFVLWLAVRFSNISFYSSLWILLPYLLFYLKEGLFTQRMNHLLETYKIFKANLFALFFTLLIHLLTPSESSALWSYFLYNTFFTPVAIYLFKKVFLRYFQENVILYYDTPFPPQEIIDYFRRSNPYGFYVQEAFSLYNAPTPCKETLLIVTSQKDRLFAQLADLLETTPHIYLIPSSYQIPLFGMEILPALHEPHLLFLFQNPLLLKYNRLIKRSIDLLLASTLGLLFFPLMLLIALIVAIETKSNPLFTQERLGFKGNRFRIYKFKTMVDNAEAILTAYLQNNPEARKEYEHYKKLRNDPRITKIGKFLRKTSLDELPQLLNVIKGEMSLVGPRPILPQEKELFGHHFRYYIRVRPGITGLWQVSGRNHLPFSERIELDTLYVRNWNLDLDFMILLKTLVIVIRREGSY